MSIEIYYFSGTGNSWAVARDIAVRTNGKLISIPSVMNKESIKVNADVIGIVFPVYYAMNNGGIPLIVNRFVRKLEDMDSKYLFAICTCAMTTITPMTSLKSILQSGGIKLSAGFSVQMPSNIIPTMQKQRQSRYNIWKQKLETINNIISSKKEGIFVKPNKVLRFFLTPVINGLKSKILKIMYEEKNTKDIPFEQIIPLRDKSFRVNNNCDGCGICSRVCPVGNIEMSDGKPSWLHNCENCLACLNWCPKKAILGGFSPSGNLYLHPEIKLADIFKE